MPEPTSSKLSAPRIAETAAGRILTALLALFYTALATTAAGGEWHTLFIDRKSTRLNSSHIL